MTNEELLLSAILKSRAVYEEAKKLDIDLSMFNEAASALYRMASIQYERDSELQATDTDLLKAQVIQHFASPSVARGTLDYLDSLPSCASPINVALEYRAALKRGAELSLAAALVSGEEGDITAAKDRLAKLDSGSDSPVGKLRLTADDYDDSGIERIPLMPNNLRRYLSGGPIRGQHVVVFGRPDSAKTLFAINQAAMAVMHGYTVLYAANEEPEKEITRRFLSRLCGIDIRQLRTRQDIADAIGLAGEYYGRWNLLHEAGMTIEDIARAAAVVKPDIVVIDQLQNLYAKDDNKALQLQSLARKAREIAIKHDCVVISLTQAGDSGEQKPRLRMTDVDWSKTGIQAAVDLLIGIGVTDELYSHNERVLSITKNKINAKRGSLTVYIDPHMTAMFGYKRGK